MSNGIRKDSILSPGELNIYFDELDILLPSSKVGYHIRGKPLDNFTYADDSTIPGPSARAKEHFFEFSVAKSFVLLIIPKTFKLVAKPKIYLGESILFYSERFKNLGHTLTDFADDEEVHRENTIWV